ncbi:unnamed protein product [Lactuca virosa]|uniref:SWIM-type domain-containing protein n=1 Tax=Lactuca virosa TaxID=75947 RepID=A0AAU9LSJ0_9ASTR|nr:unnamed protein product [Lactuca virosa]
MNTVDDLDTIDMELDELFKHKQRSRCKDEFLNTLIYEALDKCKFQKGLQWSWYAHPSGLNAYKVRNGFHSYGVNLEGMYYTCRLWELSGISCVHAQATIIYTQQDPARFISTRFGKDKFLATYESNILPVNGSNMWEPIPYTKPLPPVERRMPGRPSSNVESQFVTQTTPTVDSEHLPETQEADVKIDVEGDSLDMADLDQILHDLSNLRESKYSEAEILLCLNITQSQLKGFDALLHQSKQVAKEDNEDGAEDDEDGAEDDEEGVDNTQVRIRNQVGPMNLLPGFVGLHDVHLPTGSLQNHVALNACLRDRILLLLPTELEDAILVEFCFDGG